MIPLTLISKHVDRLPNFVMQASTFYQDWENWRKVFLKYCFWMSTVVGQVPLDWLYCDLGLASRLGLGRLCGLDQASHPVLESVGHMQEWILWHRNISNLGARCGRMVMGTCGKWARPWVLVSLGCTGAFLQHQGRHTWCSLFVSAGRAVFKVPIWLSDG